MQKKCRIEDAIGKKYPESVVLVTTCDRKEKANVMAVGWVAIASGEPLMFMLGIDDGALTFRNIRQTKEFVVAFPNEAMGRETLFAGSNHGHKMDKFEDSGLAVQKAVKVKSPLVRDAVANFECRLAKIYKPGDCPIVIGEVISAHVNRNASLKRLYTVGKGHKLAGVRKH